jgi:hypothetical protein
MEWYQYLAGFWAGAFLTNVIPHFVHGVSGNKFPTPWSNPRGIGLSSPTVNVIWGLVNGVIGYVLFRASQLDNDHPLSLIVFFAGIAFMSIYISKHFQKKEKE